MAATAQQRPRRSPTPAQRLIDRRGIEAEYGLPARTVYDLFVNGRLPGVQVGRRLWFLRSDIEEFLAASRTRRGLLATK